MSRLFGAASLAVALLLAVAAIAASHTPPDAALAVHIPDDWEVEVVDETLHARSAAHKLELRVRAGKTLTSKRLPDGLPRPQGRAKIGRFKPSGKPEKVDLDGYLIIRFSGHLTVDDEPVEAERWMLMRTPNPERGKLAASISADGWGQDTLDNHQRETIRSIMMSVHDGD